MQQLSGYLHVPVVLLLLAATMQALAGTPLLAATAPVGRAETMVNRYTALALRPDAADLDPTQIIAQVSFPRMNTKSVGDAVRFLLVRTGYDLVPDSALDHQVVALLAKRLPDSQRALGPFQVRTMLQILVGPAFEMTTDHAARLISFRPVPIGTGGEAIPQNATPEKAAPSDQTAN